MLRRTIKHLLGVLCLLLGLLALVTPFTPGSWLAFVGIELLGLTFLLPYSIRSRWEGFKMRIAEKWHHWKWKRKLRKNAAAAARAATPHAGGRGT